MKNLRSSLNALKLCSSFPMILPIFLPSGSLDVAYVLVQNLCILHQNQLIFFTHRCTTSFLRLKKIYHRMSKKLVWIGNLVSFCFFRICLISLNWLTTGLACGICCNLACSHIASKSCAVKMHWRKCSTVEH